MSIDKAISSATRRLLDGVRKPFTAFANNFASLAVSRAELAPRFIKAFGAYQKDTGGTFVSFVALLDPSVPVNDRDSYRAHKAYQAATYLRRLSGRTDVGANRARPMRSNLTNLARAIATIQLWVSDVEAFWKGIGAEFGLKPRQLTKLRQVVSASKPLVDIKAKPQPVKFIHVETADITTAGEVPPSTRKRAAA